MWVFSDRERTQVQVTCPDCGVIEMTRQEFDCVEVDMQGPVIDEVT